MIRLFLTAYLQILFVSANTYFISQVAWLGIAICSFAISYLLTLNVRRISAATTVERIVYSAGAMAGGLSGVFIGKFILL